jgi:inosine/xanthosine triphosphatase
MKIIIVASNNPVKIEAALNGFRRMFPEEIFSTQTVSVASGVKDQPSSSAEALCGATNRAQNAREQSPQGDYWIGIEGGIEELDDEMAGFAWIVVYSSSRCGKARTGTFFLPERVSELVRQGIELGDADDLVFNRTNSKQENGAIGILTGNVLDRTQLYEHAVILALVPFKNPELYPVFGL